MKAGTWLLATVAALGAIALIARNPLHVRTVESGLPAPSPTGSLADAEVVLVTSPSRVRERSRTERDNAFAWVSFVEQEFGPWRLAEPGEAGGLALDEARLVVVPESAWDDLTANDTAALTAAATSGRAVVVVEGHAARAGSLGPHALPVTDFASALAGMQQGHAAPGADAFHGVPDGFVQPHAFRNPGAPVRAFVPVADVREASLLAAIDAALPVASWWRFPDAAPAYVAVTHDEEGFGDRSAWLPEAFAARGVASSAFVETDAISRAGVEAMRTARSDVHLHWDRGFLGTEPLDRVRVAGFVPAARRPSLMEQAERARALGMDTASDENSDIGGAVLNRTHGLVFDPDPARTFRMLHAAGIDVDSTYGPAGPGRIGYLFGTGLPFRPLDSTGWPFPILEVPFVFQDDEEWSRADQDRLVREAATLHHQLVVTVYHVNAMARQPSEELIEGTLAIGETADAVGASHGSIVPFLAHWRARLVSPLHTSGSASRLRIEAGARADGMAVRVAATPSSRVLLDGAQVEPIVHGPHLLVRVPRGAHVIEVLR